MPIENVKVSAKLSLKLYSASVIPEDPCVLFRSGIYWLVIRFIGAEKSSEAIENVPEILKE